MTPAIRALDDMGFATETDAQALADHASGPALIALPAALAAAPSLTPFLGGLSVDPRGWRARFAVLLALILLAPGSVPLSLPETDPNRGRRAIQGPLAVTGPGRASPASRLRPD